MKVLSQIALIILCCIALVYFWHSFRHTHWGWHSDSCYYCTIESMDKSLEDIDRQAEIDMRYLEYLDSMDKAAGVK